MPNPTDLVESDNKKQTKQDASQRLSEEVSENIFRIGAGTAFRVADGRLVTAFHNIHGCSEIFASQGDKYYRVGKNIQIDDINGLAVLEFVDSAPPQPKGVLAPTQRSLTPKEFTSIAGSDFLGKPSVEYGQFRKQLVEEDSPRTFSSVIGAWLRTPALLKSRELSDAQLFARRPLLELVPAVSSSMAGGPVLSERGEIMGLTLKSTAQKSYAIPGEKVSQLLAGKPEDSKFIITSGYENGVQKYLRDWERDRCSALLETGKIAVKTLSLAGVVSGRPSLLWLAIASDTYQIVKDANGLKGATNNRDKWYYGAALSADALTYAGMMMWAFPRTSGIGKAVYGAGLVGRTACELIPNKYVIQKIERRDGDLRPPFVPTL
jgi:hypothetical protein